jgi:hypothetical protein
MDIYYRGFDSNSPISSGAKHLTACAARLLLAMLRSIQYMDDAAVEAFHEYISVDNIWLLCLMLAGWLLGGQSSVERLARQSVQSWRFLAPKSYSSVSTISMRR